MNSKIDLCCHRPFFVFFKGLVNFLFTKRFLIDLRKLILQNLGVLINNILKGYSINYIKLSPYIGHLESFLNKLNVLFVEILLNGLRLGRFLGLMFIILCF